MLYHPPLDHVYSPMHSLNQVRSLTLSEFRSSPRPPSIAARGHSYLMCSVAAFQNLRIGRNIEL